MIICEECGARNRNDAYVCAACGASLLHLEATADDETLPAPSKRRTPLFGHKARQWDVEAAPEYQDAGAKDAPEPMDTEPDDLQYQDEPEEDEVPVRHGLFGRKVRPRHAEEEPKHSDGDAKPVDAVPDDLHYQYEPEEDAVAARRGLFGRKRRDVEEEPEYNDNGAKSAVELRFVFEEPAEEIAPEAGYEPEDLRDVTASGMGDGEPGPAATGYETGEPAVQDGAEQYIADAVEAETPEIEDASGTEEEEETQDLSALQEEPPEDSIEIEAPEYMEPEDEPPRYMNARSDRSQTVHVHVARVKADRPRTMENAVPSRISVEMDEEEYGEEPYDEPFDESEERGGMTGGMIAAIVTVASLLVVAMVVLGILLIGKSRTASVITTGAPATVTATAAAEAPTPSPVMTPSPEPIPTTNPAE